MKRRYWLLLVALTLAGMGLWRGAQPPDLVDELSDVPAPTTDRRVRTVEVLDGTAIINGEIDYSLYNGLIEALAANPDVTRLRITSGGGLVPAARAIARQVTLHGIEVEAEGLCASACVLIFMAGERRVLAEGATLGFHAWRDKGMAHLFGQPDPQLRDAEYLIGRGVDPDFVAQIFATPHDMLWVPTRAELTAAGVLR